MTSADKTDTARSIEAAFNRAMSTLVLVAVIFFWCAEAFMNFKFGAKEYHPVIGLILVAAAVCAAFFCIQMCAVRGRDKRAWALRAKYGLPWALCFFLCQVAGWNVLGTFLGDGGQTRANKALAQTSSSGSLKAKIAQRDKLGAQRSPDQVQSDIAATLAKVTRGGQTIAQLSQDCANPAAAPTSCRQLATLRTELAAAQTYARLEQEIAAGTSSVGATAGVTEGNWHAKVFGRMSSDATPDEVTFWAPVYLTLLVGLISNFGFPWVGFGGHGDASSARPQHPDPASVPHEDFFAQLPHLRRYAPAGVGLPSPRMFDADGEHAGSMAPGSSPGGGGATLHHSAAPAHMHGAPISINVSTAPGPSLPAYGAAAAAPHGPVPAGLVSAPLPHASGPHAANAAVSGLAAQPVLPPRPRHDLPAIACDAPVDRSRLTGLLGPDAQPAIDVCATFRATCTVDAGGAMTPLADLYRRYRAFAGPRAVAAEAFEALVEAAGIACVRIGDTIHARDLVMKPMLAEVG